MPDDTAAVASAIIAGASVVISIYSAWVAKQALTSNKNTEAFARISADAAKSSAEAAAKSLTQSATIADENFRLTRDIFKRQHVIDLHMAWHGAKALDPSKFDDNDYVAEIVQAGNLLGLTATMWNHDIVDKTIIIQNYWDAFTQYYDALKGRTTTIPKLKKTGDAFLTQDIEAAYEGTQTIKGMKALHAELEAARRSSAPQSLI